MITDNPLEALLTHSSLNPQNVGRLLKYRVITLSLQLIISIIVVLRGLRESCAYLYITCSNRGLEKGHGGLTTI